MWYTDLAMVHNPYIKLGILMDAVDALNKVIGNVWKQKNINVTTSDYEVEIATNITDLPLNKCELEVKINLTPKEKFVVERLEISLYETEIPVLATVDGQRIIASMTCFDNVDFNIVMVNGSMKLDYYNNEGEAKFSYLAERGLEDFESNELSKKYHEILNELERLCFGQDEFYDAIMKHIGRVDAGNFNDDNTVMQYEYISRINPKTVYKEGEKAKVFETQIDKDGKWSIDYDFGLYTDLSALYGNEVAEQAVQNMLKRLYDQDTTHEVYLTR